MPAASRDARPGRTERIIGRRPRRALLAVIVAAVVLLAACTSAASTRSAPTPAPTIGSQLNIPVASSILNQQLVDEHGTSVRLSDFRRKVLVISDMMTLCQETCPLDTATLVQTARAVQSAGLGGRVQFLSITVDPTRDTPDRLEAFRDLFAPVPTDWTLLTGSPAAVAALWKYFGVYYQKVPESSPPAKDWMTGRPLTYDIDHADLVLFVDGQEKERFAIDGPGHVEPGTPLPAKLKSFLNADGRANLANPDASAWTAEQALQVLSWLTNRKINP